MLSTLRETSADPASNKDAPFLTKDSHGTQGVFPVTLTAALWCSRHVFAEKSSLRKGKFLVHGLTARWQQG